jgi:hypothetical protein
LVVGMHYTPMALYFYEWSKTWLNEHSPNF